jgi:hypothetical protein
MVHAAICNTETFTSESRDVLEYLGKAIESHYATKLNMNSIGQRTTSFSLCILMRNEKNGMHQAKGIREARCIFQLWLGTMNSSEGIINQKQFKHNNCQKSNMVIIQCGETPESLLTCITIHQGAQFSPK